MAEKLLTLDTHAPRSSACCLPACVSTPPHLTWKWGCREECRAHVLKSFLCAWHFPVLPSERVSAVCLACYAFKIPIRNLQQDAHGSALRRWARPHTQATRHHTPCFAPIASARRWAGVRRLRAGARPSAIQPQPYSTALLTTSKTSRRVHLLPPLAPSVPAASLLGPAGPMPLQRVGLSWTLRLTPLKWPPCAGSGDIGHGDESERAHLMHRPANQTGAMKQSSNL